MKMVMWKNFLIVLSLVVLMTNGYFMKKDLNPFRSTKIKVTFNSTERLVNQDKVISIYTNEDDNSITLSRIK